MRLLKITCLTRKLVRVKKLTCYTKTIRAGKIKPIGTDMDLRPKYNGIEVVKYDVIMCPLCGYAALSRYYGQLGMVQKQMVYDQIGKRVVVHSFSDSIYSYIEAFERYNQ